MTKTTVEANGKGHFEISFTDGLNDIAFYDKSLAEVVWSIQNQSSYREPKSISWVEDK